MYSDYVNCFTRGKDCEKPALIRRRLNVFKDHRTCRIIGDFARDSITCTGNNLSGIASHFATQSGKIATQITIYTVHYAADLYCV